MDTKKKMLIICPHFMGYDEKIIEYLSDYFEVDYIDSEKELSNIRKRYKKRNAIIKVALKIFPYLRGKYRENMLKSIDQNYFKILNKDKEYDVILAINGDGMSDRIYKLVASQFQTARFILYIWDDLKGLFKTNHLKYFDDIYCYNIEDCNKCRFTYLPMFTQPVHMQKPLDKKYDIAIIATANNERVKLAKQLYEKYKNIYKFYIYFYSPETRFDFSEHSKPLSFDDYMSILENSKAVLEVVRHKQKGPTTRMFDALETKTKVITTNRHIINYPGFSKNFLILDNKHLILEEFINDSYDDIDYSPIYISDWAKEVLKNI